MPSAAPPLAYRPGLDAVRAVAILLVIIGHWTQPYFPISLMGSMTFFVLSGYFISGIVWKQEVYVGAPGRWPRRLGVFYLRRLVRTLPPYYLSLAAGFLLPLATLHQYPGWFLVPVSNLLFYRLQHWGEGVGHYWTMAVDEQFYLFWPVLLAVLPRRVRWLALVAVASLLFRLAWSYWVKPGLVFALLPGCLDMFAAGGILRHIEQQPAVRRLARLHWVALAWLAWASLWATLNATEAHANWQLVYSTAGCIPAVLTLNWALHQPTRPASESRLTAAMRWLGQRSYGCYLYHLMLPVFYQRAIFRLFPTTETRHFWLSPIPTVLLLLPLLLLLAAASWHWLEAPLNRWKNRLAYEK
jgi:peptidoglycan/LPS O-acetylase OafA/YrhL